MAKVKKAKPTGLTPKQKKFCHEYLVDLNATQAAIRAGYSEKTAKEIGSENLTKPHIAEYIAKILDSIRSENIATLEEVLEFFSKTMRDDKTDIRERLRAAEDHMKYYGTQVDKEKIAIERQRLKFEEERLELEKRKIASAEPDKEMTIVIKGYDESWCN